MDVKSAKGKRIYGLVERPQTSRPTKEQLEAAMVMGGGQIDQGMLDQMYRRTTKTVFVDHAPERDEGVTSEDERLVESLAAAIQRAAERRGVA